MGIPEVQFWTVSSCSFVRYLIYRELIRRGVSPFKNDDCLTDGTLDTPVDWITGMPDVRLRDLPSFLRTTDPNDIMFNFLGEEAQTCLKASAIIFDTFQEFEKKALDAVASHFNFFNIYLIGPLPLLARHVPEGEEAIGAFLTHCGWNSMAEESICGGVPVICRPFFADQQTNCHYSCSKWGVGMEINHDVKRGEVAELVKAMMEGERGKKMRIKAKEWNRMAEAATDVGEASYVSFDEFIRKGLRYED